MNMVSNSIRNDTIMCIIWVVNIYFNNLGLTCLKAKQVYYIANDVEIVDHKLTW